MPKHNTIAWDSTHKLWVVRVYLRKSDKIPIMTKTFLSKFNAENYILKVEQGIIDFLNNNNKPTQHRWTRNDNF